MWDHKVPVLTMIRKGKTDPPKEGMPGEPQETLSPEDEQGRA